MGNRSRAAWKTAEACPRAAVRAARRWFAAPAHAQTRWLVNGGVAINPGRPLECEFPRGTILLAPALMPSISPLARKYCHARERLPYGGPGTAETDYSPSYGLAPEYMPQDWQWRNDDPGHEPVLNAQSPPGSLLVTESAIFSRWATNVGLVAAAGLPTSDTANTPASDNVNGIYGPAVPAGIHEMYNDGSVRWVPMSKIKARVMGPNGIYFGW